MTDRQQKWKIRIAEPVITDDDVKMVVEALRKKCLSPGEYAQKFEKAFATYIGAKKAVAVNSGTAALHLCLAALDIGPGDEVITTPFSIAATSNVIVCQGAKPVFVDIEPETYNLDPKRIEAAITPKTKAIMPIHYGGQCAEMDEIMEIAEKHGLWVIEDAAPAAGSLYKGRKAGVLGHAAGFSFFPDKNMTTGEGGMITTNIPSIAEKAWILSRHGAPSRYHNIYVGWNFKMPDFAAALGLSQLKRLEQVLEQKNRLAQYYTDRLKEIKRLHPPKVKPYNRHTFMLYAIRTEKPVIRERVKKALYKEGIETRINFPPIHLQPAYLKLFKYKKGAFPITEHVADTILGLPIYLDLSSKQQDLIVSTIANVLSVKD